MSTFLIIETRPVRDGGCFSMVTQFLSSHPATQMKGAGPDTFLIGCLTIKAFSRRNAHIQQLLHRIRTIISMFD
jgi:hypothetical protein